MPILKRGTIMPTPEEDAAITAAAMPDANAMPLTDEEWETARPLARIGRPPSAKPLKVPTTIRFDADVLAALKASGKGWQTQPSAIGSRRILPHRANALALTALLRGSIAQVLM